MPELSDTKNRWKEEKILEITKFIVHLQSQSDRNGHFEIWCNGSTTDSGSVSEGSNPSISTIFCSQALCAWFLRLKASKACFRKLLGTKTKGGGASAGCETLYRPPQALKDSANGVSGILKNSWRGSSAG